MKKFTLMAVLVIIATLSFSQTPLSTAVDFTATTTEGVELSLFDILDNGQYVCIDFFFTT